MKRARMRGLFYFAVEEGSSKRPVSYFFLVAFFFAAFFFATFFLAFFFVAFFFVAFFFVAFFFYFFLSLLLRYFFLSRPLGDFFLRYAFFRRGFLLCCFLTGLLFGSHTFLRVGYPGLSIYNKIKKTSKRVMQWLMRKSAALVATFYEPKVFCSTAKKSDAIGIRQLQKLRREIDTAMQAS